MTSDQQPAVTWHGNVPISTRFDDPYFSFEDGQAESRHVFLAGNGLPARFQPGFRVAELGFGTGLNCLSTWALWRDAGHETPLSFTSFEMYPMDANDMAQAISVFPTLSTLAAPIIQARREGKFSVTLPDLHLDIIPGDARETLPNWPGLADAWFLDGFAPSKNPELWEPELLNEVAVHSAQNATLATYSAAGAVRRGLEDVGFSVSRRTGFGRKRHMTVARLK